MQPVPGCVTKLFCFAMCLFGLASTPSLAETVLEPQNHDKTLSPYFVVTGDDSGAEPLPLKSTRADAAISGMIAQVKVTQIYQNRGNKTLEAVYVFPASTRAAVYALKMTVGERVIEAKVKEREQARRDYEQALQQGRTASLLEQQRPNVFQMNVGNILPGDEIKVELDYTELLIPKDSVYEFVYPTVVGPRYSNVQAKNATATETWVQNPYLHQGEEAPYTFGLDLTLNSGMPIAKVTSPSHAIDVHYDGPRTATIALKEASDAGNRDFVLQYVLAGDRIESGLLLYPGPKENFFLMMMEPPKRVAAKAIVPREYIFIIDVSGSMHGFPLDTTKALMRDLFSHLRPNDFFNILFFSGGNYTLSEKSLPATPENVRKALDAMNGQSGGGGTELMPALRKALALPRAEGTSRSAIIVTDGYVSVEKDAFAYIRQNLGHANLFAFGIGSSVNRYLIEGMARAGMGEPFIILEPAKASAEADRFRKYIDSPVLTGIRAQFKGLDAYDVEPAGIPDLFAQRPVIIFGKYRGKPTGAIQITGEAEGGRFTKILSLQDAVISEKNAALRYLWARHRITQLADMNKLDPGDERVKEVTGLGLTYNLLTDYTSFVAVDTVKRADGKHITTVKQPLPLPQGVSDYAVGGARGGMGAMKCMAAPCSVAREAEDAVCSTEPRKSEAARPVTKSNGRVELKLSEISGPLGETEIRSTLAKLLPKLQQNYAAALASDSGLQGEITVRLAVGKDGKVAHAAVSVDTLNDQGIVDGLLKKLRELRFAGTARGTTFVVTFVFKN